MSRRLRRRAEADRHAIIGVDQADRDGEVGELLFAELASRGLELGIGDGCLGDPRHCFRPTERRALLFREQIAGLAQPARGRASRPRSRP